MTDDGLTDAEWIMRDQKVRATRRKIDRLEQQLADLYAQRKEMIIEMSADMTRREIAEQWGISNPRVTNIVNEGSAWRAPGGEG